MFGYVSVYKPELKIKEYELYKSLYCGLCRKMGRSYGGVPCFFLNYDIVFLLLILEWAGDNRGKTVHGRCMFNPLKKKCFYTKTPAVDYAAGVGILLLYNKAVDNINDGKLFKRIGGRILRLLLSFSYKKAKGLYPSINDRIEESIAALHKIESNPDDTIDHPADTFASMLGDLCSNFLEDSQNRDAVYLICRDIGRFIYILDAYEDMEEDIFQNSFNPLFYRFSKKKKENLKDFRKRILTEVNSTLTMTLASAYRALSEVQGGCGCLESVVSNILLAGLPAKQHQILYGKGNTKDGSL